MLYTEQLAAFENIKDFLYDPSSQVFILKGYAGTGKTTLIKHICDFLATIEVPFLLTAPTGRAARIMSEKTKLSAKTIHSTIYSPSFSDFDDEEKEDEILLFSTKSDNKFADTVLIIDEASMISDKQDEGSQLQFGSGSLLKDIISFMNLKSNNSNKIIFVGDPAQLPPVNDPLSPALSKDYLKDKYHLNAEEVTLKEIIRQGKESSIISNSISLRESLEKGCYDNFDIQESDEIIKLNTFDDIRFSELSNDRVMITFTNRRALYYNLSYRDKVLNFDNSKLSLGDRLLVISNNYKYKLFNGDFVTVEQILSNSIETREVTIEGIEYKFEFIDTVISHDDSSKKLNVKLLLNSMFNDKSSISFKEQKALRILTERIEKIKRPRSYSSQDDKIEYFEKLAESPYLNALQVKFGYAVTCHKAQGGEWKDVIVDFKDFQSYTNEFFFRWAYTSITRSSERLILINPPKISKNEVTTHNEFYQHSESEYYKVHNSIKQPKIIKSNDEQKGKSDIRKTLLIKTVEQMLKNIGIKTKFEITANDYFVIECFDEKDSCLIRISFNEKYIITAIDKDFLDNTNERLLNKCIFALNNPKKIK
jgi:hypothetical protein